MNRPRIGIDRPRSFSRSAFAPRIRVPLEARLAETFVAHPPAEIITSLPGMDPNPGAELVVAPETSRILPTQAASPLPPDSSRSAAVSASDDVIYGN